MLTVLYDSVMFLGMSDASWTIDELGHAVADALAVGYEGPSNGQVRAVPDRRTIRYYTTLGLIDRPAAFSRRTALYGRRHLLQLVAIKRLQASGLSLTEVQERLAGIGETKLAAIAKLPGSKSSARAIRKEAGLEARTFWSESPAEVAPPRGKEPAATLTGIDLGGATLLVRGELGAEDAKAIRNAAAPLLTVLKTRGLLDGPA